MSFKGGVDRHHRNGRRRQQPEASGNPVAARQSIPSSLPTACGCFLPAPTMRRGTSTKPRSTPTLPCTASRTIRIITFILRMVLTGRSSSAMSNCSRAWKKAAPFPRQSSAVRTWEAHLLPNTARVFLRRPACRIRTRRSCRRRTTLPGLPNSGPSISPPVQRTCSSASPERAPRILAVSPDGKVVAFVSMTEAQNSPANLDIYTINMDGTGLTQRTFFPGQDICPRWSGNGGALYFLSQRMMPGMGRLEDGAARIPWRALCRLRLMELPQTPENRY